MVVSSQTMWYVNGDYPVNSLKPNTNVVNRHTK